MVIAVCGAQNTGKSTFIKDFLAKYPMYSTPTMSYRDLLKSENLPSSSKTTVDTQNKIREFMDTQNSFMKRGEDNIILDRCHIDWFVYSLWAYFNKTEGFDDAYILNAIEVTKHAMRNVDMVLYIPRAYDRIKLVDDGIRDIDESYVDAIDQIFSRIFNEFRYSGKCDIFADGDSPGVIEIFGSREQRLAIAGLYVEESTGNIIVDEKSVLSDESLTDMEKVIQFSKQIEKQQYHKAKSEDFIREKMKE